MFVVVGSWWKVGNSLPSSEKSSISSAVIDIIDSIRRESIFKEHNVSSDEKDKN